MGSAIGQVQTGTEFKEISNLMVPTATESKRRNQKLRAKRLETWSTVGAE